jgi:hypothetical protein
MGISSHSIPDLPSSPAAGGSMQVPYYSDCMRAHGHTEHLRLSLIMRGNAELIDPCEKLLGRSKTKQHLRNTKPSAAPSILSIHAYSDQYSSSMPLRSQHSSSQALNELPHQESELVALASCSDGPATRAYTQVGLEPASAKACRADEQQPGVTHDCVGSGARVAFRIPLPSHNGLEQFETHIKQPWVLTPEVWLRYGVSAIMRCDAMRCDTMRFESRCDAMRCDAIREPMRCDAMRCDAMRCDASRP